MTEQHLNGRAGQRIINALADYAAKNTRIRGLTSKLISGLKGGHLTNRHFTAFEKDCLSLSELFPVNMGVTIKHFPKQKSISAFFGYMSVGDNGESGFDPSYYTPSSLRRVITPTRYYTENNIAPLRFRAEHTAFRFIQRTGGIFDIKDDAFRRSLMISTHVAQSYLSEGDFAPRPIIIPHERGLFLGYVEGMPQEEFSISMEDCTRIERGGVQYDNGYRLPEEQPFRPAAFITLKTFFDAARLSPDQLALRAAINSAIDDGYQVNASSLHYAYYSNFQYLGEMPDKAVQHMAALSERLQNIFHSAMWCVTANKAIENGHIPEKGLASLLYDIPAPD